MEPIEHYIIVGDPMLEIPKHKALLMGKKVDPPPGYEFLELFIHLGVRKLFEEDNGNVYYSLSEDRFVVSEVTTGCAIVAIYGDVSEEETIKTTYDAITRKKPKDILKIMSSKVCNWDALEEAYPHYYLNRRNET